MKGIFKLFSTALTVVALASCAGDDLQVGQKAPEQNLEAGDLIITYDPLDNAVTRGYRQGDFSMTQNRPMVYGEGDVFKVYDPDMFKYEVYNFDPTQKAFFKTNSVTITDPKFVLFPGDQVMRGYYDSDEDRTIAEINIPRIIEYNADSEVFVDEEGTVTGYAYNLPMLGKANPLAGGKMGANNMRHLTAILKIDLENVYGNAMWLRITNQAGKVMSGTIAAVLDVSSDEARKAVKLDPSVNKPDLVTYPDMYVDLRNVPSPKSVIFIPIIEGLTEADNIKLEYTAYPGDLDETPGSDWLALIEQGDAGWATATTEQKWVNTGMEFPGINFKHNNLYEGSNVFSFGNMSPNKISQLLNQYKETTSNIAIDLTDDLAMDDNTIANPAGFEILVPTLTNNKDIAINLASTFATITNDGGNPATKLVIANAEGADFTGKFTLNVADKLPANTDLDIEVNLPNADIIILGDYDAIKAGNTLNLIAAKSVTIGDATSAAGSTKVSDAKLQLLALGDDVQAFTIAKSATVDATSNQVTGGKNTAAITVNGALTGDVVGSGAADAVANIITIGEDATVTGAISGGNANTITTVNGQVTNGVSVGKANTNVTVSATGVIVANGIRSTSEVENTIDIAGPVTGDVASVPAVATQYAGKKTDVNISGAGRVDGDIDLAKNLLGKLEITAVPTDNGTTTQIVTGDVVTGGFVTVNLTPATTGAYKSGEGVAIEGTLTMTGATKELKLIQGYINEIEVEVNNAGEWENKYIALTLNDANEGIAAFANLTETTGFVKYTESVWDGKYPTNPAYNRTTTSAPISAEKSLYKAAYPNAMFTATQLAYYAEYQLGTFIHLFNDLDMKSLPFKGMLDPSAAVTFEGKIKNAATDHTKHKIKNLKLYREEVHTGVGDTHTSAAPMGLFAYATQALTIDHIELTNVEAQTALMPYAAAFTTHTDCGGAIVGVGALVGTTTAKVTAKYVDVTLKNQNFGFTGTTKGDNFVNVGGLIGYAADGADIQNTNVSGAPISGYRALGGIIGTAVKGTNDYEFTATTTNVTFNQAIANDNTMDCWYASIGGFIGLCSAKPNVTLVGTANAAAAISDDTFSGKKYVSSTSTSDGRFYNFTRNQNFLGFAGRVAADADYGFGTVKINGATWTVPGVVPYTGATTTSLYYFQTEHTN